MINLNAKFNFNLPYECAMEKFGPGFCFAELDVENVQMDRYFQINNQSSKRHINR